MTIEEIKTKYGTGSCGYIECADCPLSLRECGNKHMSGYRDCWNTIKRHFDGESNQFDPDMMKALDGILCDINPAEIAGQIERDHLGQWCETIRAEILKKVSEKNE